MTGEEMVVIKVIFVALLVLPVIALCIWLTELLSKYLLSTSTTRSKKGASRRR